MKFVNSSLLVAALDLVNFPSMKRAEVPELPSLNLGIQLPLTPL